MDVFEVIFEYCKGDEKEITNEINYWTGNFKSVSDVAMQHGFEYEKELKSVRYILTITRQTKPVDADA